MKTYLECPSCRGTVKAPTESGEFYNMVSAEVRVCKLCSHKFLIDTNAPHQTISHKDVIREGSDS